MNATPAGIKKTSSRAGMAGLKLKDLQIDIASPLLAIASYNYGIHYYPVKRIRLHNRCNFSTPSTLITVEIHLD